jgi:CheY-like chemotaxis protein
MLGPRRVRESQAHGLARPARMRSGSCWLKMMPPSAWPCATSWDAWYGVVLAANRPEALDHWHAQPVPRVLVIDSQMPVMDGCTFRVLQRANPAFAAIRGRRDATTVDDACV